MQRILASFVLALLSSAPALAQPRPQPGRPIVPADRGVSDRAAPDLWLATAEGYEPFTVQAIHGTESLARVFEITLDVTTSDTTLDPADLLGQPVTLGIRTGPSSFRIRSAYVFSVSSSGVITSDDGSRSQRIHVDLAPWLAALARTSRFAIFENVSVVDAARSVLGRYAFARVDFRIQGPHPAHERLVQHGDSDFEFLRQILAPEGLYWFFEHDAHGHTLVITDAEGPPASSRRPVLTYGGADPRQSIEGLHVRAMIGSNGYRVSAENPADPHRPFVVERELRGPRPFGALVISDRIEHPFPSREALDRFAAGSVAGLRLDDYSIGETESPELEVGMAFRVTGHPRSEANGEYRVVGSTYSVDTYGQQPGAPVSMRSSLDVVPLRVPYRMPVTRASVALGVQTATVIGPNAGQVHSDAQGRVRVRFHWPSARGQEPSAWIPVLGGAWRPRAGDLVLVQFLDGDPARPVVWSQPAP